MLCPTILNILLDLAPRDFDKKQMVKNAGIARSAQSDPIEIKVFP